MGTDYRQSAAEYALREVAGTDLLAFRQIAGRIAELGLRGRALDVGCGAGRSTRFLKSLGFWTTGVDVSDAMLAQARMRDPGGSYEQCDARGLLPFDDDSFDVALSTWVVLEIQSLDGLVRLIREMARVLKPGGTAFVVANAPEFYSGRWVSCEVGFPENAPPLKSGQQVKARLLPEGVIVGDTYWSDADYRAAFSTAALQVSNAWRPFAPVGEEGWMDECRVAPWIVYEVVR